jgi:hypothetical protein
MSVVALAKVETHDLLRRAAAPSVRMLMIWVAIVGLSLGCGERGPGPRGCRGFDSSQIGRSRQWVSPT